PRQVEGRRLAMAEAAGGRIVNRDRMWHYTEGIKNWGPVWPRHGIRIFPGRLRFGSMHGAGVFLLRTSPVLTHWERLKRTIKRVITIRGLFERKKSLKDYLRYYAQRKHQH